MQTRTHTPIVIGDSDILPPSREEDEEDDDEEDEDEG